MPLSLTDLSYGCIIPAVTALVLGLLAARTESTSSHGGDEKSKSALGDWLSSLGILIAFIAGVLVGYWLLALAPWTPKSHRDFWPYAVALACGIAWLGDNLLARFSILRYLLYALASVPIAWYLIPTWSDLEPDRTTYIAVMTAICTLTAAGIDQTLQSPSGRSQSQDNYAHLTLVAFQFVAVCTTFLSGTLRFTQIIMIPMACVVALQLFPSTRRMVHKLVFPIAIAFVGMLVIAQVNSNSQVPILVYLMVALAPCVPEVMRRVVGKDAVGNDREGEAAASKSPASKSPASKNPASNKTGQPSWFSRIAVAYFWLPGLWLLLSLVWGIVAKFAIGSEQSEY